MHVIIVGAGPSGLTLSLLLSKASIKTTLFDAGPTLDTRPRAAHYAPSAVCVLRDAGVLSDVRKEGFIPGDFMWRKIDGTPITGITDTEESRGEDGLTVLPLNLLGKVLLRHVERAGTEVRWNSKVVGTGQDGESAWAVVSGSDGKEERIKGDYVVGCDGGNSTVRKSLFGGSFPGKTWDAQIVATNVYYPLNTFSYSDINNIIHPTDYYMAARISRSPPYLYRVSYGESTHLTHSEVLANQPTKFQRMLPGNPTPDKYKLLNVGPYKIHQRCAERMTVGRICLAADAAHLCNPFGGLGLTGGLVDVGGLAECLIGIYRNIIDEEKVAAELEKFDKEEGEKGNVEKGVLGLYDRIRRKKWRDVINPISSGNFLRVSALDPERACVDDEFLGMCVEMEKEGKEGKLRKEWEESMYDVCHDFKQYWKKDGGGVENKGLRTSKL